MFYSEHAKDRMRERGISKEEVEACIENPDVTYPTNEDYDCVNHVKTFPNGRRVRVVINEQTKTIITAIEVQGAI